MTELNINKTHWKKVKFGDIVIEPKESTKDLVADGFEHIVGLEHIDSGDIHLRKSETEDLETSFTKIFRKGDVLFGRRRAYLKKAALAEFDGICSGDITVFRVKKDLIPELLPFIVHNEKFFDFAVKHSAGGLSPRVKFKDLANYEFLLPPLDQQKQLAKLLWAMDEVIEKEKEVRANYERYFRRFLIDSVNGSLSKNKDSWKEVSFGKISDYFNGLSGKSKKDFGSGAPFITYMNIFKNTKVDITQVDYVNIKNGEKQNNLKYGDILFTGSSETPDEVGMSSVFLEKDENNKIYLNSFCFGFRLENFDTLLPEYARFLMRGQEVRTFMFRHAQGSTRFNLSKTTVKKKLKFVLPEIREQQEISERLEKMEDLLFEFDSKIHSSEQLLRSLIHQIF